MDPNSQEYMDLYAYVASLTPAVYKAMKKFEGDRKALMKKMAGQGGGRGNPCNPCAPRGGNPCAPKGNPCGNPCAPRR